jgi:hypothetical protein
MAVTCVVGCTVLGRWGEEDTKAEPSLAYNRMRDGSGFDDGPTCDRHVAHVEHRTVHGGAARCLMIPCSPFPMVGLGS